MTTRQVLRKMLTDKGMLDRQADAVLAKAIPEIERLSPDYQITWDRPASEYPDALYNAMLETLCDVARKWIEKNAPQAWFRPMFD